MDAPWLGVSLVSYVDARIANLVVADVKVIYADTGIKLNLNKCRFVIPPGTTLPPNGLLGFPVERSGCIVLGCPVGIPSYRHAAAMTIAKKASRSLPAFSTLHAWTSLALIRHCVSARLGFLARVCELADNLIAFSFFDDRIDVAIQTSCGITEDEFSLNGYGRVLRSLPAGAGGLSIPRFAGLAGETACLLLREKTYDYLEVYQPNLLRSAETNWPPIAMGQIEDQWIYLNDPITDESDPNAEPRSSSFEGEALFLASGETDLLPCATKTEYPWVRPAMASASLSSRANPLSVQNPFAVLSITAALAISSPSSTIAATNPSPSGLRAPCSMALVAGSPARGETFMAATPFGHPLNIRWRYVCVFYSLPRPWTSALRGPSYVPAVT
jgi:hypothetical protein